MENELIELAAHHNTSPKLCNNLKLISVDLQGSNIQIKITESPLKINSFAHESLSPVDLPTPRLQDGYQVPPPKPLKPFTKLMF